MEHDLMANYCEYTTPKDMWNDLFDTYRKKRDDFQMNDFTVKANKMKRGSDNVNNFSTISNGYEGRSRHDNQI